MRNVTVEKTELENIVRRNRDKHRDTFLEAQEVYRTRVIDWLGQRLEDARNGSKITRYIELPEPVDYTDQYDRVLHMLEMSVDNNVELNWQDFDRYVRDKWEWSDTFAANTEVYTQSR